MNDPFNLQRFVDAQNQEYDAVCSELRKGRKTGHWIWFIFPQMRGLGHSELSNWFGISSFEEAVAYLEHPILGPRLRECTQLMNAIRTTNIEEIFGYPDDLKFRSSMTLFAQASKDNPLFLEALNKYFDGEFDPETLKLLAGACA